MNKINKYSHKIKNNNGCWEWQGYLNKGGYGNQIVGSRKDGSRRQKLAHRLFYELAYGEFDTNLCVLHRCDNPSCVNPGHLFLGTRLDNARDMAKKGRRVDLRGEQRPNSKLTEEQVHSIKVKLNEGYLQKDIAKEYSVNQTLISAIKLNRVWSHI